MLKKDLWIIAGPNGSGKTTLVNFYQTKLKRDLLFVNPDDIAKQIDPSYDGRDTSLIQKAGKLAIERQNALLTEGISFGYETTFSGQRDLKKIQAAQAEGYNVKLVFIGLNSYIDNIERVNDRVRDGGHYVLPADIIRRYDRSMNNLKKAIDMADSIYIFDNSSDRHRLFVRMKNKKILRYSWKMPEWIKKLDIKKSQERGISK